MFESPRRLACKLHNQAKNAPSNNRIAKSNRVQYHHTKEPPRRTDPSLGADGAKISAERTRARDTKTDTPAELKSRYDYEEPLSL
jgi:hypothetical protein